MRSLIILRSSYSFIVLKENVLSLQGILISETLEENFSASTEPIFAKKELNSFDISFLFRISLPSLEMVTDVLFLSLPGTSSLRVFHNCLGCDLSSIIHNVDLLTFF